MIFTVTTLIFLNLIVWNCKLYLKIVYHNNQMHPVLIMATTMVNGKQTLLQWTLSSFVLRDKGIEEGEGVKRRIWIESEFDLYLKYW